MAGLRELRGRINSVKNTKKITYAMKLVSATKLKRSQELATNAREYSSKIWQMLAKSLAEGADLQHPLAEKRKNIKRVCLLVVSANRGLCGAYNSNINKAIVRLRKELKQTNAKVDIDVVVLGRKSAEFMRLKNIPYSKSYETLLEDPSTWPITEVCENLEVAYLAGKYDQAILVYTYAKSALTMSVKTEQILPFDLHSEVSKHEAAGPGVFKPSLEKLFDALVPRAMRTKVRQACLESKAAEHAARMTAMDSATKNAGDLTKRLTLKLNKLRQSSITGEILDIVGGAEAIK